MSHSVEITTPILPAEKVADRLGISKERRRSLLEMARSDRARSRNRTPTEQSGAKKAQSIGKAAKRGKASY